MQIRNFEIEIEFLFVIILQKLLGIEVEFLFRILLKITERFLGIEVEFLHRTKRKLNAFGVEYNEFLFSIIIKENLHNVFGID